MHFTGNFLTLAHLQLATREFVRKSSVAEVAQVAWNLPLLRWWAVFPVRWCLSGSCSVVQIETPCLNKYQRPVGCTCKVLLAIFPFVLECSQCHSQLLHNVRRKAGSLTCHCLQPCALKSLGLRREDTLVLSMGGTLQVSLNFPFF